MFTITYANKLGISISALHYAVYAHCSDLSLSSCTHQFLSISISASSLALDFGPLFSLTQPINILDACAPPLYDFQLQTVIFWQHNLLLLPAS